VFLIHGEERYNPGNLLKARTVQEQLRWFLSELQRSARVAERVGSRPAVAPNPYSPVQKELCRVDPRPYPRPRSDPTQSPGSRPGRRVVARSLVGMVSPIAPENSKYLKGAPFVPIILYLYISIVHPISNIVLNAFSYL